MSPHSTERQPHYRLSWTASARNDVMALAAAQGADIAGAALIAATDVEYGRRRGKALGDRNVTGNLSGLFRVKFDLTRGTPNASGWSTATSARNAYSNDFPIEWDAYTTTLHHHAAEEERDMFPHAHHFGVTELVAHGAVMTSLLNQRRRSLRTELRVRVKGTVLRRL